MTNQGNGMFQTDDNRSKMMLVAGILLLVLYGYTGNSPPQADAALEARCRAAITQRGGNLAGRIDQCREKAFATAMTATDAQAAARAIGSANQTETLTHFISMAALGGGTILSVMGALGLLGLIRRRDKA